MDHQERFEDLVSAIKANGVPEDYFSASSSSTHLLEKLLAGLSSYHQDLSHHGLTSRMRSCAISLMSHVLRT